MASATCLLVTTPKRTTPRKSAQKTNNWGNYTCEYWVKQLTCSFGLLVAYNRIFKYLEANELNVFLPLLRACSAEDRYVMYPGGWGDELNWKKPTTRGWKFRSHSYIPIKLTVYGAHAAWKHLQSMQISPTVPHDRRGILQAWLSMGGKWAAWWLAG